MFTDTVWEFIDYTSYIMDEQNLCGNLFLLKCLPRKYRKNKSLVKLNRFTVSYGLELCINVSSFLVQLGL